MPRSLFIDGGHFDSPLHVEWAVVRLSLKKGGVIDGWIKIDPTNTPCRWIYRGIQRHSFSYGGRQDGDRARIYLEALAGIDDDRLIF